MSTLYKPVLIETAEQAAALPDAAIVIGVETGERYTRAFEGDWWGVTEMGTSIAVDLDMGDAVMALVPIEAEEEFTAELRYPGKEQAHLSQPATRDHAAWQHTAFPKLSTGNTYARLVTPWEEA